MKKLEDYHLSYNGYRLLVALSGYKNKPYKMPSGEYTVGLKHTGEDIIPDKTYTDEEIYELFCQDKHKYEEDVRKIFDPRFMTQHMFDACVCFAYSVGTISGTELGKLISKNPYDDKIESVWKYTYTNAMKNKSLVKRRKREVEYYFRDDD